VTCELLEVPAGKINQGEAHFTCGVRELQEETGAVPRNFEYLGFILPCVGYSSEKLHIYLATGLKFGKTSPDEGEFVENVFVSTRDIDEMILSGKIVDGKTIAAVSLAKIYLKKEGRLDLWDGK
jgi:ADP-ribose pyrophosphatase